MGWNFFRSINLGGGIRLNLSKKGLGYSFGIPGVRMSTGPSGDRFYASIPGTGIYYRKSLGNQKARTETGEILVGEEYLENDSNVMNHEDKKSLLFQLYFGDALALIKSNRLTEAFNKLSKGLKIKRDSADSYFLRSVILYRQNNPQRAIKELLNALDIVDYLGKEIKKEAVKCKIELQITSKHMVNLSFNHSSLIILLAECFSDIGEEKRCYGLLSEYLKANPNAIDALCVIMRKNYEAKQYESVIGLHKQFTQSILSSKSILCEVLYAYSEFYSGNKDLALNHVNVLQTKVTGSELYASIDKVKHHMVSLTGNVPEKHDHSQLQELPSSGALISDSAKEQYRLFILVGYLIASADGSISEQEIAGIVTNKIFSEVVGSHSIEKLQEELVKIKSSGHHRNIDDQLRTLSDSSLKLRLISFAFDIAYSDMEFSPKEYDAIKYVAWCLNFHENKLESIRDQAELDFIRDNFDKLAKDKKVWLIESLNKRGLHAKNIGSLLGLSSKDVRALKSTRPLKRLPEEMQQEIVHYIKGK